VSERARCFDTKSRHPKSLTFVAANARFCPCLHIHLDQFKDCEESKQNDDLNKTYTCPVSLSTDLVPRPTHRPISLAGCGDKLSHDTFMLPIHSCDISARSQSQRHAHLCVLGHESRSRIQLQHCRSRREFRRVSQHPKQESTLCSCLCRPCAWHHEPCAVLSARSSYMVLVASFTTRGRGWRGLGGQEPGPCAGQSLDCWSPGNRQRCAE